MASEDRPPRKDRLLQTRVPKQLEATLKEEARRRRLTVSHLIRNVLEESFQLVDGLVSDVDQIVADSAKLARNVGRSARRVVDASLPEPPARAIADASPPEPPAKAIADASPPEPPAKAIADASPPEPPAKAEGEDPLSHVYAWNEVVLNKAVHCSICDAEIGRGRTGFAGLNEEPSGRRAWLCTDCMRSL